MIGDEKRSSKVDDELSTRRRDDENLFIEDAVRGTEGRTCISSFYHGLYCVNLSPSQRRNQKISMEKIRSADVKQQDPKVYNQWEGR